MDRKTETAKSSSDIFDPVAAFKPMMPSHWMGQAWLENLTELGAEITSFVAERIKEDVKTQHEMLHCKSLTELQHVQGKFIEKALEQYQAESGKLVAMTDEMAAKLKAPENKNS